MVKSMQINVNLCKNYVIWVNLSRNDFLPCLKLSMGIKPRTPALSFDFALDRRIYYSLFIQDFEPERGFEPPTFTLRKCCSTTELLRL